MFIILLDEPTLFVFESEESVRRDIEPPDAEVIVRAIFDEKAIPYQVEWLRPNIHRKWLLGVGSVQFGEYGLKPCGEANPSALIRLLKEYGDHVDPPSYKDSIARLLKTLEQE